MAIVFGDVKLTCTDNWHRVCAHSEGHLISRHQWAKRAPLPRLHFMSTNVLIGIPWMRNQGAPKKIEPPEILQPKLELFRLVQKIVFRS